MTPEDIDRIAALLDEAHHLGGSAEDVQIQILTEMPHLTPADVQEVVEMFASEVRIAASSANARAEALQKIAGVLEEVAATSGEARMTTERAHEILSARAAQGDTRATELLRILNEAVVVLQIE